jgi:hypothetical protein
MIIRQDAGFFLQARCNTNGTCMSLVVFLPSLSNDVNIAELRLETTSHFSTHELLGLNRHQMHGSDLEGGERRIIRRCIRIDTTAGHSTVLGAGDAREHQPLKCERMRPALRQRGEAEGQTQL